MGHSGMVWVKVAPSSGSLNSGVMVEEDEEEEEEVQEEGLRQW